MTPTPRLTVIVTQRERYSLSERSLETVLADRSIPYRLIYVDAGAPEPLAGWLERRARETGFELLRLPGPAWPNHGRIAALASVDSEYVVFMDNDGLLAPGSLAAMVECADATGAGLVGPLYLWSDGVAPPRIHMAGGTLREVVRPGGGRAVYEIHEKLDADLAEADALTAPVPCDFLEYHCMLARTDLVRGPQGLDPDIVCVHEHIDISLAARARGLPVLLEPRARVDYLALADYRLQDLPFFRWRWHPEAVNGSLAAFSRKWDILDDPEAFAGVRDFTALHVGRKMPTLQTPDPDPGDGAESDAPAQSLGLLLRQLVRRGYGADAQRAVARAHDLAIRLFDGCYRACGRPFLNHAVGVAAVLVRFRLRPDIVLAGLLHAAYSHGRAAHGTAAGEIARRIAGTFGDRVEGLVRAHHDRQRDPAAFDLARPDPAALTVDDAAVLAIAMANGIEELANGEIAASLKPSQIDPATLDHLAAVSRHMEIPGLGDMLRRLHAEASAAPIRLKRTGTFRPAPETLTEIDGRTYPMAGRPAGAPADVAVVLAGRPGPGLLRALGSVFAQTYAGAVEVLIGITGDDDGDGGGVVALHQRLERRPANVGARVLASGDTPGAAGDGTLRAALALLSHAPLVTFLGERDWFLRSHLTRMTAAVEGFDWAWSLRWLADAETAARFCRDTWEAVGPGRGVLAQPAGGSVDRSCLIVDKRRVGNALVLASDGDGSRLMRALAGNHSAGWSDEHSVACGIRAGSLQWALANEPGFHARLADAGRRRWPYGRILSRWPDLRAAVERATASS